MTGPKLAFLKIRYKLPGSATSRLMNRPITEADAVRTLAAAPQATRWAISVAGFGQKLRRDAHLDESWGWSEIAALAGSSRGGDPNGERAEFIQLVKAAADAKAPNDMKN
jgi:Ca-activated chloride channel family protein